MPNISADFILSKSPFLGRAFSSWHTFLGQKCACMMVARIKFVTCGIWTQDLSTYCIFLENLTYAFAHRNEKAENHCPFHFLFPPPNGIERFAFSFLLSLCYLKHKPDILGALTDSQ